jgi:guanylate kinase
MSQGRLVILSGPSGVGKDTVINAWQARNPDVARVVAYTTRDPRPGELDGMDYNFVSRELFHAKAADGDFLEFKEVHGNFYATPLSDMDAMLEDGKIAILKIDVQGALTAMELRSDALTVFLMPPSVEELEARIRGRGTEDDATIAKRLKNAHDEMSVRDRYQHIVVNQDVEDTVDILERLVL